GAGILKEAARAAHFRRRVEKDFHFRLRKDLGSDVASFHDNAAAGAHFLLAPHHPLPHRRMYGDSGSSAGHVLETNALGDVLAIEQDLVTFAARKQVNARLPRECAQRLAVVEWNALRNRLQSKRAIHGAALDVDVSVPARQPCRQRALARASRAIDGDHDGPRSQRFCGVAGVALGFGFGFGFGFIHAPASAGPGYDAAPAPEQDAGAFLFLPASTPVRAPPEER